MHRVQLRFDGCAVSHVRGCCTRPGRGFVLRVSGFRPLLSTFSCRPCLRAAFRWLYCRPGPTRVSRTAVRHGAVCMAAKAGAGAGASGSAASRRSGRRGERAVSVWCAMGAALYFDIPLWSHPTQLPLRFANPLCALTCVPPRTGPLHATTSVFPLPKPQGARYCL